MNTQLLCTFSDPEGLSSTLADIPRHYSVVGNRVFVLENADDPAELFCTYNIDTGVASNRVMRSTISVHRKRRTNTIYTINALNALIRELNGGTLDTSYAIPWEDYDHRIILADGGTPNHIHTDLRDIKDV